MATPISDLAAALCERFAYHHDCCEHDNSNEFERCSNEWMEANVTAVAAFVLGYLARQEPRMTDHNCQADPRCDGLYVCSRDEGIKAVDNDEPATR